MSLSPEAWPPGLDALIAAPKHHQVLFENDRVRVLDTRIAPGDTVPETCNIIRYMFPG